LRFRIADGLRVRLVDVPAALEARGFVGDGRVVVEIEDRFCPWNEGRFAIEVSAGAASCSRSDDEPDIACSATDLGATYLGGATFRQLHRAGRVDEVRSGALERVDAMFAADPAPWSPFIF
jgi:predicted acetyltransferase